MKKLTQKQFDIIMEKHKLWLDGKEGGERALLQQVDLSNLSTKEHDLRFALFQDAWLKQANFSHSNLKCARFVDSNLTEVDFKSANLTKTLFYSSNLTGADIRRTNFKDSEVYNSNLHYIKADFLIYQVSEVGSRKGFTYYIPQEDRVICGCWQDYKGGNLREFKNRIELIYGEHGECPSEKYFAQYTAVIKYFESIKEAI